MLHTVNKSPYSNDSLQLCLEYAQPGDVILLLEDGVYAAMDVGDSAALVKEHLNSKTIVAIGPDLQLRGVSREKMLKGVEAVSYADFVNLAAAHDKVQSWL